jgi:hypothetical protein
MSSHSAIQQERKEKEMFHRIRWYPNPDPIYVFDVPGASSLFEFDVQSLDDF